MRIVPLLQVDRSLIFVSPAAFALLSKRNFRERFRIEKQSPLLSHLGDQFLGFGKPTGVALGTRPMRGGKRPLKPSI